MKKISILVILLLFIIGLPNVRVYSACPAGSGDVDGSGKIMPGDALLVLRHIASRKKILTQEQLARADVDGDCKVTQLDAANILKLAIGKKRKDLGLPESVEGTILQDKTLPQGTIKINNDNPYTNSFSVTLTLTATDSESGMGQGSQMQFSNDGSKWSSPENYATTKKAWTLTSGDGTKTVYAKFKDKAGNWSAPVPPIKDTIILDTVAPKGSILINNGDTATDNWDVNLTLSIDEKPLDNDDVFTKLLLNTDGVDGSVNFTDTHGHKIVANGNARIDTTQSKFGEASVRFDGSGDYLSLLDSNDWSFGNGDFTIDCWVRFNALPANNNEAAVYSQFADGSHLVFFQVGVDGNRASYLQFFHYNEGTIFNVQGNTPFVVNTWYHIAAVRNGNIITIYKNGLAIASGSSASGIADLAASITIGAASGGVSAFLNGWIDEFRVSKGAGRWISNFTPPTEAYLTGLNAKAQMQFSNDGSKWSTLEDYADTKSWRLSDGFGKRTVYVRFQDAAGNPSSVISNTIEVTKAPNKERIYIYLNGQRVAMEENSKKFFFHSDHLGSTSVVTDESGQQVKYLDYKPYGETKTEEGSLSVKKKFTGKELDDSTGLYNNLARLYDPKIGRFVSADPIDFSDAGIRFAGGKDLQTFLANPQNLNRYSYCLNNPLRYVDPDGLFIILIHGVDKKQGQAWMKRLKKELLKRGVKQDIYFYKWGPAGYWNFGSKTSKYAKDFINFVEKIRAKYYKSEPVNIFSHSAGSVLVNKALKLGLKVDNVIIAGSPIINDFNSFITNTKETHSFESARDQVNLWISGWWDDERGIIYHGYDKIRHNDWTAPWSINNAGKREEILSEYTRILNYREQKK